MDATTSLIPNRCTFTPLASGEQLQGGRYIIQKLLGKGGMGIVYLAADRNLPGRFVAIKENSDVSCHAQEQFQQEATILARLNHPNLPRVTDHFIEPSGQQYLVMDYIEGSDLREILKDQRGPLPERVVLAWIDQVMNALEYLHHWFNPATHCLSPIVHCDIKPGNIKLTPNGCVVLVDFGLAKYEEVREGNNASARSVTAGYSPVEQYTGGATVRSDIYALGATLYTLLTGQRPPDSPALTTGSHLPSPRQLNPQISCHTEQVILCAMQAQASKRYQHVAEMRTALQNRGQVVADPNNIIQQTVVYTLPPQHAQRRQFPNLRILSIGLLLLLVLAIGIVLSTPNGEPWNGLSMLTPLSSVIIPYPSLSGVYDLVDHKNRFL
jgi:serine/threonine-protein kinase